MNGTAPSTLIAVHISATIAKPSRVLIVLWRLRTGSQNASPIAAASAKVIEKCAAWPSRYTSDTASGRISVVLNSMNSTPRVRSEEHTSELQSRENLVCRLLLEKKKRISS